MANRPVFVLKEEPPYYQEELVSFQFNPGFSIVQKQKNIRNIHEAFISKHNEAKILEISTKSEQPTGVQLSAFNLLISVGGIRTSVESAFQSSKVFECGGPYTEILIQPSYIAKKDPRLKTSGALKKFDLDGQEFPLEPKTFFYDWLYINAVNENRALAMSLCQFNAFTDIEFNPEKSINCQARSAAIFVSLSMSGKLEEALISPEHFKSTVYGLDTDAASQQLSLFGQGLNIHAKTKKEE